MPDAFSTPEPSARPDGALQPPSNDARQIGEEIAELARLAILEAAKMREIRSRLAELSERMLELTPPPLLAEEIDPESLQPGRS